MLSAALMPKYSEYEALVETGHYAQPLAGGVG